MRAYPMSSAERKRPQPNGQLGRTLCKRRRCLRRIRADCRRRRDAGLPRQRKRDPFPPVNAPRSGQRLNSDAKCNTPRRFDIGKVVQDLKECCHAILLASVGGRERPDRRFAGRGAVDGGHWPGRSVARKPPSPGNYSGTLSPRADIRRFTPPEPINCAGGVKRSSNEKPLYACSWGIGSPKDGRPNRSPVG
jgi:hypothetical protein